MRLFLVPLSIVVHVYLCLWHARYFTEEPVSVLKGVQPQTLAHRRISVVTSALARDQRAVESNLLATFPPW